jgi:hypothetical protein
MLQPDPDLPCFLLLDGQVVGGPQHAHHLHHPRQQLLPNLKNHITRGLRMKNSRVSRKLLGISPKYLILVGMGWSGCSPRIFCTLDFSGISSYLHARGKMNFKMNVFVVVNEYRHYIRQKKSNNFNLESFRPIGAPRFFQN